MDGERFDLLTRSVSTISRRGGLLAGVSAVVVASSGAHTVEEAKAKKKRKKRKKKKVRCAAGELRCRHQCCGPGFNCDAGDRKIKGKKQPLKHCLSTCAGNGSQCGTATCGNGGPGSDCATTVTTEGEDFCLDFVKANDVGCGAICRKSTDCGPGGVCVCMNNAPTCSCGEGVETSCFVRADVACA